MKPGLLWLSPVLPKPSFSATESLRKGVSWNRRERGHLFAFLRHPYGPWEVTYQGRQRFSWTFATWIQDFIFILKTFHGTVIVRFPVQNLLHELLHVQHAALSLRKKVFAGLLPLTPLLALNFLWKIIWPFSCLSALFCSVSLCVSVWKNLHGISAEAEKWELRKTLSSASLVLGGRHLFRTHRPGGGRWGLSKRPGGTRQPQVGNDGQQWLMPQRVTRLCFIHSFIHLFIAAFIYLFILRGFVLKPYLPFFLIIKSTGSKEIIWGIQKHMGKWTCYNVNQLPVPAASDKNILLGHFLYLLLIPKRIRFCASMCLVPCEPECYWTFTSSFENFLLSFFLIFLRGNSFGWHEVFKTIFGGENI